MESDAACAHLLLDSLAVLAWIPIDAVDLFAFSGADLGSLEEGCTRSKSSFLVSLSNCWYCCAILRVYFS